MSPIKISRQWISGNLLFCFVIALAAAIRFYQSFHVLLTDEVFNLITIKTLVAGEGYAEYFFRHPPLYILLSSYISSVVGNYPQAPSFVSIMFSALSFIPFYLIVEQITDKKVALLASLFLAVMPSNIYYSTWIKQDAMLLFFFLWGIHFYLNRRHLLAGLIIGIALLVKEFAVFFFPLSFLITSFNGEKQKDWHGWLKMSIVSAIISSWWYLFFGKSFYTVTSEALTGENIKEVIWHFPWWFYIKNIPYDLSYPIFILFIAGGVVLVKELRRYLIPLLWLLVFFVPLSLITVKAPWYTYLATPAMAVIAAIGGARLQEIFKPRLFYSVLLSAIIFSLYNFDNIRYFEGITGFPMSQIAKEAQGTSWEEMLAKREFWERKVKDRGKIGFLEFHPTLQYLMDIPNDSIVLLKVANFIALDREGLLGLVRGHSIEGLVVNTDSLTYTEKNLEDMHFLWGEPALQGSFLFFLTGERVNY